MIGLFLDSWGLFHNSYLAGWWMGALLSMIGVLVIARQQIFLTAAIAQASTFGVATGLWLGGVIANDALPWIHTDGFLSALAIGFAVAAALVTARGGRFKGESLEAVTGWIFLLASSGAVLLLSHSPHGLEEVHRLSSSSLIGASRVDVWVFGCLTILVSMALWRCHWRILLVALDPLMAEAMGIRTRWWNAALAIALGFGIGLSIRAAGMLYTFGCLVLPSLIGKNLCHEISGMFLIAPLMALLASLTGFILANYFDYPPAQMTIVLLCLLLALAWLQRAVRG